MANKQLPQKKMIANMVANEVKKLQVNQGNELTRQRFNFVGSSNLGFELTGGYHASDAKRNVWQMAGYPDQIEFENLWNMTERNGIAHAASNLPIDKTWQDFPSITDGEKEEGATKTQFEKDLDILVKKHKLFHRLKALDKRQAVGRYGGFVIIAKELAQKQPTDEINPIGGVHSIVKFVPCYESQIIVNPSHIIDDVSNPRYGDPTQYEFRSYVTGSRSPLDQAGRRNLHYSRVFAWGEDSDDGTIFGVPCLLGCYNALLDYEKIRAAAAEGHYKNAKQRFTLNINDSQVASALKGNAKDDFDQQVNDFEDGWGNSLQMYGMEAKTLQSDIQDPEQPKNICIQEVAAHRKIPSTILIGQQTGRLASDEDQSQWGQTINARRDNEANEMITLFLEHLIEHKMLTPPSNYIHIEWNDLTEPSSSDKMALAKDMALTNKTLFDSGASEPAFSNEEIREAAGHDKQIKGDIDELKDYTEADLDEGEDA